MHTHTHTHTHTYTHTHAHAPTHVRANTPMHACMHAACLCVGTSVRPSQSRSVPFHRQSPRNSGNYSLCERADRLRSEGAAAACQAAPAAGAHRRLAAHNRQRGQAVRSSRTVSRPHRRYRFAYWGASRRRRVARGQNLLSQETQARADRLRRC